VRRHYGLPQRRIVDLAQREPERWPWRKALLFIGLLCAGAWIAIGFLVGQVLE
jgi:hypothetical protein